MIKKNNELFVAGDATATVEGGIQRLWGQTPALQ